MNDIIVVLGGAVLLAIALYMTYTIGLYQGYTQIAKLVAKSTLDASQKGEKKKNGDDI